jgi:hypothetical protein
MPVITNPDGTPKEHGVPTLVAELPNAFWVRGHGKRVYVMTLDNAIYEYVVATGEMILRKEAAGGSSRFCFMAVDEFGSIGPVGRIYWSDVAALKTIVFALDPDTWEASSFSRWSQINGSRWGYRLGSETANVEPLGHYIWGFSPHATRPAVLACGITSSSWFLWQGCLGKLPTTDALYDRENVYECQFGTNDRWLAPSAVWGFHGHGGIGYSADEFRDFRSWEEARETVMERLEPFFVSSVTETVRENVGRYLFMQRTRPIFWE